jgi:surfeit locus 1 family protein
MQFHFSLKTSLICLLLSALMFYASYWQYTKYIAKTAYVQELDNRIKLPIENLESILALNPDLGAILNRKVKISGEWDYAHEIIIRNRKHEGKAGVLVLTPLKLRAPAGSTVLVNRGFIPISHSNPENRKIFQAEIKAEQISGLIKASVAKKFLAPPDPISGLDKAWVDAWLRIDIESISKQMPYPLIPFYIETLPVDNLGLDSSKMLLTKSDKDQILFMPGAGQASLNSIHSQEDLSKYPIPFYDPIVPPDRHFSYIFEWAIMGLMVIAAAIIIQLKRH